MFVISFISLLKLIIHCYHHNFDIVRCRTCLYILLLPLTQVYSTCTCSHSFCLTQASAKRLLVACTRKGTGKGKGRRNWACVRSEGNVKKSLLRSFPPSRISSFPPLSAPVAKANLLREFLLHTYVIVLTQSFIYMHT